MSDTTLVDVASGLIDSVDRLTAEIRRANDLKVKELNARGVPT